MINIPSALISRRPDGPERILRRASVYGSWVYQPLRTGPVLDVSFPSIRSEGWSGESFGIE